MAGTGDIDPQERLRRTIAVLSVIGVVGVAVVFLMGDEPLTGSGDGGVEVASLPPLSLSDIDGALDYDLAQVAELKTVPQVFVPEITVNLDRIRDVDAKKAAFFRILLPWVARENDRLRDLRAKILETPDDVSPSVYADYDVELGDTDTLLRRVDVIPASLVLAQAALESGWGTSRFARKGNNFFGMRTFNEDAPGIAPKEAEGFKVMVFDDIAHSVRAYMHNLNTFHPYDDLRAARAAMRDGGDLPNGRGLTDYLTAYSEVPKKYGGKLRAIMDANDLDRFDGVRLAARAVSG